MNRGLAIRLSRCLETVRTKRGESKRSGAITLTAKETSDLQVALTNAFLHVTSNDYDKLNEALKRVRSREAYAEVFGMEDGA